MLRALLAKDYNKYDLVGRAKEQGLDRLVAWIEVILLASSMALVVQQFLSFLRGLASMDCGSALARHMVGC